MIETSEKLFEPEIKALILNHLFESGSIDNNSCVINELTVDNFSRRVDIAVVNNDQLIAIEVKSHFDSLGRLEGQLDKYLDHFDKVIVVASEKHISRVLEMAPVNVGVWQVCNDGKRLKVFRRGRIKKARKKENFIRALNVNELKELARRHNIKLNGNNRKSIEFSISRLSSNHLRRFFIEALKKKYEKTSSAMIDAIEAKPVTASDINLMSPYKAARDAAKKLKQETHNVWDDWLTQSQELRKNSQVITLKKGDDSNINSINCKITN
ncbi:sce7726 family protein [Methylophaga sp.]|uniref:sce7726 family protein n=1 Tax=Methylophaga sp. TaxID=2024840 RepID=UPI003A8D58E5